MSDQYILKKNQPGQFWKLLSLKFEGVEKFKRRLHTIVATQVSVTDWKVRIQPLSLSSHLTSGRLLCGSGNGNHGTDWCALILDKGFAQCV